MPQPARLPPDVIEALAELLAADYFRRKAEAVPAAEVPEAGDPEEQK